MAQFLFIFILFSCYSKNLITFSNGNSRQQYQDDHQHNSPRNTLDDSGTSDNEMAQNSLISSTQNENDKMKVRRQYGIEFLQMFTDVVDEFNRTKFTRLTNDLQITFMLTCIKMKLVEKQLSIGKNLSRIGNYFLNYCAEQFNDAISSDSNCNNDAILSKGKKICVVGMTISLAEFIFEELTKIIGKMSAASGGQRKWFHWLKHYSMPWGSSKHNQIDNVTLHHTLAVAAISIEHMFIFWSRLKEHYINANNKLAAIIVDQNGSTNNYGNNDNEDTANAMVAAQNIKTKLEGLTRKTMSKIVTTKLEMEDQD